MSVVTSPGAVFSMMRCKFSSKVTVAWMDFGELKITLCGDENNLQIHWLVHNRKNINNVNN